MWKKCGTTRQATDDNITLRMRFACLIKKKSTHSKYVNSHCFSTVTMVKWSYLNITLYIHCFELDGSHPVVWHDKHIYFHVINNINKTHNIKCYNLMVLGYMFRPHCGHLQANLYRLSALNVRTIWNPILYAHWGHLICTSWPEVCSQEPLSCTT